MLENLKTVRWNAKNKIAAMLAAGRNCMVFTLDNYFKGEPRTTEQLKEAIERAMERPAGYRGRLWTDVRPEGHKRGAGVTTLTFHVHGNLFWEIEIPAELA